MSSPPSSSASSSLFASLRARPPTPPRDISKDVDDALRFLQEGHESPRPKPPAVKGIVAADTPPAKAHASPRDSTATKKVGFTPNPIYHDIPQIGHSSSPANRVLRQTPLARVTKPLKSILKAANERVPLTPDDVESKLSAFSPSEPGSFRRMLQDIIVRLGAPSRDGRRDAYLAMNSTIKTYESLPEPEVLVDKIDLLCQFLSRDMAWKDASGRPDTHIVTQAVQLTCALLHNNETAHAFDDDFRNFILDRSISVLEHGDVPRAIFKSHLQLLAVQRFRSPIMTITRIEKIISALSKLEDRNSNVAARLIIYQRLIEQAPAAMLNKIRDWIENVFHGMLSSVSDVQRRAIDTCATAGNHLGTHHQAGKAIYELCEKETEEGSVYGDYINLQLIRMSADKDKAALVPQIWAAVILMFRSKRRPIDRWSKLKDWLLTIQKCLNSSDLEVKQHANVAWNKLVFTVMPDSSVAESMRSMLKVPINAGLEKRGNDKLSQQMRQIAMDSYCNLLHYALRPALSHEEIDSAWDMYVQPVLAHMAKTTPKGQQNACRILHGLLKRTTGTWNENAANEKEAIKPDELPRLDARWVRSRLDRMIKLIEPMLLTGMWLPPESNRSMDATWRTLMRAVAEAGAQEVKTSIELKDAIAQLTNLFRRLWLAPSNARPESDSTTWISRYQFLLQVAVEALGSAHFVEDILTKTNADEVEVAPTPSHRISKNHGSACPSFVFLFSLYFQESPSVRFEASRRDSAAWLLQLHANAKGSTAGTLSLLNRTLLFCSDFQSNQLREIPSLIWGAIADTAMDTLRAQRTVSPQRDAVMMGSALRSTLNIILEGLQYAGASAERLEQVSQLYQAACEAAKHAAGNGGVVLGVMEPLSKSILDRVSTVAPHTLLHLSTAISAHGVWPKNRAELESSRKALWTVNLEPPKAQAFDAFDNVYKLSDACFETSYGQFPSAGAKLIQSTSSALATLAEFLESCPSATLLVALRRYQAGLALWVEDPQRLIFPLDGGSASSSPETDALVRFRSRTHELWRIILRLVEDCCTGKDSFVLGALEPLFIAGLSSPSQDVVNTTIVFWNSTFGSQSKLEYPTRLLPILRARQAQTIIYLPGFPQATATEQTVNLPAFAETQLTVADRRRGSTVPRATPEVRKKPLMENIFIKQHLAAQGLPYNAVTVAASSSNNPTPQPRLRHNDSQVDFQPITSTRSLAIVESQVLTEHQKEVQARQRDDAQMFPEFSSSPMLRSTAAPRNISKKLSFSDNPQNSEQDGINVTPTGPNGGMPMSDDLPSSPTPRAVVVARPTAEPVEDSDRDDTTEVDPPSSPPREDDEYVSMGDLLDDQPDVAADKTEVSGADYQTASEEVEREDSPASTDTPRDDRLVTDLPSDTLLPSAQLRREAEAAEPAPTRESVLPQQSPQSPSRIQNSVIELEDESNEASSVADDTQSKSPKVTRKRKRTGRTGYPSKKQQKPQSPWNSLKSKIFGYSQEEDHIEDEIVVATRAVSSPASSPRERDASPLPQAQSMDVGREQHLSSQEHSQPGDKPVKRKRGRPRKSDARQSLTQSQETSRGLKRSASALSVGSTDSHMVSGLDGDEPPASKTKKIGRRPGRKCRQSQDHEEPTQDEIQHEEMDIAEADQQVGDEEHAATRCRKIAQPSSILGNLREILANCKNMILGSREEEREFDDVLFELRREVHEAGRRGQERD